MFVVGLDVDFGGVGVGFEVVDEHLTDQHLRFLRFPQCFNNRLIHYFDSLIEVGGDAVEARFGGIDGGGGLGEGGDDVAVGVPRAVAAGGVGAGEGF